MGVVGSDGQHVGTVEDLPQADKSGSAARGEHHIWEPWSTGHRCFPKPGSHTSCLSDHG